MGGNYTEMSVMALILLGFPLILVTCACSILLYHKITEDKAKVELRKMRYLYREFKPVKAYAVVLEPFYTGRVTYESRYMFYSTLEMAEHARNVMDNNGFGGATVIPMEICYREGC
jgi:hypothetical protein